MGAAPGATRRALLMGSGANRGAYYAGFMRPLQDAGIDFELMLGVSAGGIAAAWFAAGDEEALIRSWREADAYRVALHPLLGWGRRQSVDRLIQRITLRIMDLEAARTASTELWFAASRVRGPGFPLPQLVETFFSNRDARNAAELALMLRATAFVPFFNGLRSAVALDGERYLDGGLVGRVPLAAVPEGRFDEIWIAACSPTGVAELEAALRSVRRAERLVVLTPSRPLPLARWTMEWRRIEQAIHIGRRDMQAMIAAASASPRCLVCGLAASALAACDPRFEVVSPG